MAVFTLAVRGTTPILLPDPGRGTTIASERVGGEQTTVAGQRVTQTIAIKRTWTFPYPWITDAQYDLLLSWLDGRKGLGPFELRQTGVTGYALVNIGDLTHDITYIGRGSATFVLREV